MLIKERKLLTDFWVIGINYRKSDATLRGEYAVNSEQYEKILEAAPEFGVQDIFVLSTCNRTEVYGFSKDQLLLSTLLCHFTSGDHDNFKKNSYTKNANEALTHIFNVAGGLDSQILGDYEIIGQMKQAVGFAKDRSRISPFIDRLFNTVLQSSRAIRSETELSSGTVSVAYAAVKYILNKDLDLTQQNILILGSGKIGQNTCKNLVDEAGAANINIINRTNERAQELAETLGIQYLPYQELNSAIQNADIIIVATNASNPIITKDNLHHEDKKILIDLSIPNNIDPMVLEYKGINLVNVDDLSRINDETLRRRQAEVPKAKSLITYYIHEFAEWYMMQENVPVIKAVKEKLTMLNQELFSARCLHDKSTMQKTLNNMAVKMKSEERRPGCNYIEAISDYIIQAQQLKEQ